MPLKLGTAALRECVNKSCSFQRVCSCCRPGPFTFGRGHSLCRGTCCLPLASASSGDGIALLLPMSPAAAACPAVHVPPRPVPNLGYACLNNTLQQQKPMVSPPARADTTLGQAKQMPAVVPMPARQALLCSFWMGIRTHSERYCYLLWGPRTRKESEASPESGLQPPQGLRRFMLWRQSAHRLYCNLMASTAQTVQARLLPEAEMCCQACSWQVPLPQEGTFQTHALPTEAAVLLQVTTNRGLILKTLEAKGPEYAGEMGLQNVRDLLPIIQWNYENGVRLFRQAAGGCWEPELSVWPCRAEWSAVVFAAGSLPCLLAQQVSFAGLRCYVMHFLWVPLHNIILEHSTCFPLHTKLAVPGWLGQQATLKGPKASLAVPVRHLPELRCSAVAVRGHATVDPSQPFLITP